MKILLCTVPFAPAVGGIETVSRVLAERFHVAGHEVCVATRTAAPATEAFPFEVLRAPSLAALTRAALRADVLFHNNISLGFAWPRLLGARAPWVIAHHTWIVKSGRAWLAGRVKERVLTAATHIAVSTAIAAALPVPATVIPNPYEDDVFRVDPQAERSLELAFLGRLVSDKGLPVLLDALAELARRSQHPSLTVIGVGPDEAALRHRASALGLEAQVRFVGLQRGATLVALLNRHRLLVVPSVWEEPFGIVALEGIACGLVPVVTRSGGLPEAVGRCGVVVPKGDARALAAAIGALLDSPEECARLRAQGPAHLERHRRDTVAARYLECLERAAARAPLTTVSPAKPGCG